MELRTHRALLTVDFLFHKIPGTPRLGHLQLAQPYEVPGLRGIGIAQVDASLLRLRIKLLVVSAELQPIVIIAILVAVGLSAVHIAVTPGDTVR